MTTTNCDFCKKIFGSFDELQYHQINCDVIENSDENDGFTTDDEKKTPSWELVEEDEVRVKIDNKGVVSTTNRDETTQHRENNQYNTAVVKLTDTQQNNYESDEPGEVVKAKYTLMIKHH